MSENKKIITAISIIWLLSSFGWGFFNYIYVSQPLKLNELGDWLAGASVPVVFLWFVVGYFQNAQSIKLQTEAIELQAKELHNSVQALNLQAEEMKNSVAELRKQAESTEQNSKHVGRDVFLQFAKLIQEKMHTHFMNIYMQILNESYEWAKSSPENGKLRLEQWLSSSTPEALDRLNKKRKIVEPEITSYCELYRHLLEELVALEGKDSPLYRFYSRTADAKLYEQFEKQFPSTSA